MASSRVSNKSLVLFTENPHRHVAKFRLLRMARSLLALCFIASLSEAQQTEVVPDDSAEIPTIVIELTPAAENETLETPQLEEESETVAEFDERLIQSDQLAPGILTLEQLANLIDSGAIALANRLIADNRPDPSNDDWYEWDLLYFDTASQLQQWDEIIARVAEISTQLDHDDYVQAQSFAARAEINLGRTAQARKRLRNLAWNLDYETQNVLTWRNLIIDSYLADQTYDDALVSLNRFNQDYRPDDPQWEHKYARVLLHTGDAEGAIHRVEGLQTGEGKLLALRASLVSGQAKPNEVIDNSVELEKELFGRNALRKELWGVVELAASSADDGEMQVIAIENGLSIPVAQSAGEAGVLEFSTVQDLLDAYIAYAITIGNSFGLIIGDDEEWLQLANEYEVTSPVSARALYAFLARRAIDSDLRKESVRLLAEELSKAGSFRILELLFVLEPVFDINQVTSETRIKLSNRFISSRDYTTALQILQTIDQPVGDFSELDWTLRNARVAIYAGNGDVGVELLSDLIQELPPNAEKAELDKIVQVLFDLQQINMQSQVIDLMSRLYDISDDLAFRRETLYWIAESSSELDRPIQSADLFIRSANLTNTPNDDWGQSAHYRAAEELVKANLKEDATRLFYKVRQVTLDPRRKALIDQKIQEISGAE